MAELEKILKRAIVLRDIAGEDIYNSGKYQRSGWKAVELIVHNGLAWSKDLHLPSPGKSTSTGDNNIVFAKVGEPDKQLLVLVDAARIVGDDHRLPHSFSHPRARGGSGTD